MLGQASSNIVLIFPAYGFAAGFGLMGALLMIVVFRGSGCEDALTAANAGAYANATDAEIADYHSIAAGATRRASRRSRPGGMGVRRRQGARLGLGIESVPCGSATLPEPCCCASATFAATSVSTEPTCGAARTPSAASRTRRSRASARRICSR